MRVLLLSLDDLDVTPYIGNYLIKSSDISYDCIYINKFNSKKNIEFNREYVINESKSMLLKIIKYRSIVKSIIKKNNYDVVVILHSPLSIILFDLLRAHTSKIILEIRDYSFENHKIYSYLQSIIIKKSILTVISSRGFKNFLPKYNYFIVHNHYNIDKKKIDRLERNKKYMDKLIIGQVGYIRFINLNNKLISIFEKDDRFMLSYYGAGSEKLNNNKILTSEHFSPDKTIEMYESLDLINNIYGYENMNVKYALSNKLYLSAQLQKPIIVSPNTYMAVIVKKYRLGFTFDHKSPNIEKELDSLYKEYNEFNWEDYKKNCRLFLEEVEKENMIFLNKIEQILGAKK